MTRSCIKSATAILAAVGTLGFATSDAYGIQVAEYAPFDDLTDELRSLAGSDVVSLESVGSSAEGRDIWLATIADATTGTPLEERPAILVAANLSADHLFGSHVALELIRYFANGQEDADVRDVLESHVVYVFPRVNPDGAEAFFDGILWSRSTNGRAHDGDNDGRVDEDGPEDLNGDGVITVMRVPSSSGAYLIDSDDSRFLRVADPAAGERGAYVVYWEGVDSDGDGFVNEDPPGGVDLDRNFQHQYPYYEADAGLHMVSEPESRALMDFVLAHRNIAAILTFGHTDNVVTGPDSQGRLAPARSLDLAAFANTSFDDLFAYATERAPSTFVEARPRLRGAQPGANNSPDSGSRPAETVNSRDVEYYEAVSTAYRELTGIEHVVTQREPAGAFFQYGYFQYGIPSFTTPGWGADEAEGDGDVGTLATLDGAGIDAFIEWSEYEHPDLGTVEIGGFHPYAVSNPPADRAPEAGERHGAFVVRLAGMLPDVRFGETTVTAIGGGLYEVTAEIVNDGYLPTSLYHGVVNRAVAPTTVQIQVSSDDIVAGDTKTPQTRQLLGSGGVEEYRWIVRGRQGQEIEITLRAQKGGRDRTTVTLR